MDLRGTALRSSYYLAFGAAGALLRRLTTLASGSERDADVTYSYSDADVTYKYIHTDGTVQLVLQDASGKACPIQAGSTLSWPDIVDVCQIVPCCFL